VAPGGVLMVRPRLGFRWNFWKLAVCLHTVPTTLQIAQLWLQSSNEHLTQVSDHFAHLGLAPESLTSGSPTTEPIEHRTPVPTGPIHTGETAFLFMLKTRTAEAGVQ
jgi:hypothetical protein